MAPCRLGRTLLGELEMTGNDLMFAVPSKSSGSAVTARPPVAAGAQETKQAIVLDMGEASREQGFRANGCR